MKDKILQQLRPFRIPLVILCVFLAVLLILGVALPSVRTAVNGSSPVVSITAENDTVYDSGDEIATDEFTVTAVHENGSESELSADEFTLDRNSINPIGVSTEVTVTYTEDPSISCKVDVQVQRDPIVSFQVGYPDIYGVTATLYSNGELCFEGEGEVLVCDEGDHPWLDYENMDENPIRSVSFDDGVTPTNMNYWFEGIETLTYVDTLPVTVQSLERTFADCTALTRAADWSGCTNLYNIDEVYSGCTALVDATPLVSSIRSAYQAYTGCTSLVSCPDSSGADHLTNASEMYAQCTSLADAEIGPAVEIMSGMFEDCINLRRMPSIPDRARDLSSAFNGCGVLGAAEGESEDQGNLLTNIPASAEDISNMFTDCMLLQGELTVDCDAEEFSGAFSGDTCKSTQVNLTGSSQLLDVFANTNEYGNVTVNGESPDPELTTYRDVMDRGREEAGDAPINESSSVVRNPDGSPGDIPEE